LPYTQEDIDRAREAGRKEAAIEAVVEDIHALQELVADIPDKIQEAVADGTESIRDEFRPMRLALLGNGDPSKSVCSRLERAEAYIALILKIGIPVLLCIVTGAISYGLWGQ